MADLNESGAEYIERLKAEIARKKAVSFKSSIGKEDHEAGIKRAEARLKAERDSSGIKEGEVIPFPKAKRPEPKAYKAKDEKEFYGKFKFKDAKKIKEDVVDEGEIIPMGKRLDKGDGKLPKHSASVFSFRSKDIKRNMEAKKRIKALNKEDIDMSEEQDKPVKMVPLSKEQRIIAATVKNNTAPKTSKVWDPNRNEEHDMSEEQLGEMDRQLKRFKNQRIAQLHKRSKGGDASGFSSEKEHQAYRDDSSKLAKKHVADKKKGIYFTPEEHEMSESDYKSRFKPDHEPNSKDREGRILRRHNHQINAANDEKARRETGYNPTKRELRNQRSAALKKEEYEMSESVQNIIDAALSGTAVEFKSALETTITEKIAASLEERKAQIANKLIGIEESDKEDEPSAIHSKYKNDRAKKLAMDKIKKSAKDEGVDLTDEEAEELLEAMN